MPLLKTQEHVESKVATVGLSGGNRFANSIRRFCETTNSTHTVAERTWYPRSNARSLYGKRTWAPKSTRGKKRYPPKIARGALKTPRERRRAAFTRGLSIRALSASQTH